MSGNDGWDDEDDDLAWGEDDWDDDIDDDDDDLADLDGDAEETAAVPIDPRPRRTLVATPIVSTPEPLPYDDPYDKGGYRDEYDDRAYDDGVRSSRAWAIAAVLLLLIGAGVALALVLSSDDDKGESASDVDTESSSTTQTTFNLGLPGDGGSTSTSLGTSTTAAGGAAGGVGGSSTTSTVKSTTSTTKVAPEDTNDPACSSVGSGDAAADPQPVTISFCVDDAHPKVGQTVKVTGVAKDPNSQIEPDCIRVTLDDEAIRPCSVQTSPSDPVINREFSATYVFTDDKPHSIHAAVASDPPLGSTASTVFRITAHK